jgi:oligopeptide/dipeptide ABC transporter ATP-binding protein
MTSPSGIAAAVAVVFLAIIAAFGPPIWGTKAAAVDMTRTGLQPSSANPFGTDLLGRDILARTLTATRLSLLLALSATAIGAVLGFPLGAAVAMLGPRLRAVGSRIIDAGLSFPAILLMILIASVTGRGARGAVLAIGIAWVPWLARISFTLASSVAGREYISNARLIGVTSGRLLVRYILPNCAETILITMFTAVGSILIGISSLSFLGLGVQPPQFDWGRMLIEGVKSIYVMPVAALAPAFAIAATGLSLGFLGEAIARAMNPVLWTQLEGGASPSAAVARRLRARPLSEPEPVRQDDKTTRDTAPTASGQPLLRVEGLTVVFPTPKGPIRPVDGITFDVLPGEVVGVVGESGSGKSMTALALAGLVPYPGVVSARSLFFRGHELLGLPGRQLDVLLGTEMAMVFQDPMSSLNPALRIGVQLTEVSQVHRAMDRRTALRLAVERMTDVQIPAPELRLKQYPHEFSGGMRQRAMIAMGLMSQPSLIIADEPTTALDVTIQAQIIDLLKAINQEFGTAILLISHDIGLVSSISDRVLVMYAGRIIEDMQTTNLFGSSTHPYTRALMAVVPDLEADRGKPLAMIPGRPPDLNALPAGCAFAPRCGHAFSRCAGARPPLEWVEPEHRLACWAAGDGSREGNVAWQD